MTHIGEYEFASVYVEPRLEALYGADAVEREKYITFEDGSYGWADFWVQPIEGDVSGIALAAECENDAGSIRGGVCQAQEYAMSDPLAVPVVYIPENHDERAKVDRWRTRIPIIEVATPDEQ